MKIDFSELKDTLDKVAKEYQCQLRNSLQKQIDKRLTDEILCTIRDACDLIIRV